MGSVIAGGEGAELFGGLGGGDAAGGEVVEDSLAALGIAWVFAGFEAEGDEDFFETCDDGGVGAAELFFDVFDFSAGAEEGFDEGELFAVEAGEGAGIEVAIDACAAFGALEAADDHGALAAGAGADEAGHVGEGLRG